MCLDENPFKIVQTLLENTCRLLTYIVRNTYIDDNIRNNRTQTILQKNWVRTRALVRECIFVSRFERRQVVVEQRKAIVVVVVAVSVSIQRRIRTV